MPAVPISEEFFICEGLEFDQNYLKEKGIDWFIELKFQKQSKYQSVVYTSVIAGVVGWCPTKRYVLGLNP